ILYVSVDNFHKVDRYLGTEGTAPPLSRIGGSQWEKTKRRTQEALKEMAEELLTLYAQRKVLPGQAFGVDTPWQQEMEASFEFEETPDQRIATEEIKKDLEAPYPMDRLLCGDVGFGKTEVAIRAAFKVVQEGYQVAVLVPTTILAQQHYQTFRQRLSPYPVRIEVLSRFKSLSEQKKILKDLKEGLVDIIIGTHRMLSKDVTFKRLGLLIIDEEHRFGVKHKERIKQLKANVDVLTMTATPIPRTLHMAILGVKDTSQLLTPPALRLPVMTEVHPFSPELIRQAIRFELARQGQVFLVHNWVKSIMGMKRLIERLLPDIRVGVAHGQMDERVLETTMWEFISGKIDVLVCTTIIEAGIDIPNANTLIVNRADRLGMAQLYQLKGRIGRSSRQAYAYFLIPPGYTITPQARKRLQALTEFTSLGSGIHLAMKDLEIRGAGNLLGPQQHGHINAVGFHLYTQLLNEAILKLKDKSLVSEDLRIEPTIEISYEARIPTHYIEEQDLRYELYRRIAETTNLEDLERIEEEISDRFGK
ncbi:MAG: transcription-repair coupling factor, partial [bacterium]